MKRGEQRPVGAKLKQLQDRLLELGARLTKETDADSTALVSKALAAIQNQRLSVSIVGQVSAGKTTLVNALARQPGLIARITSALDCGYHAAAFRIAWIS